MKRFSLAAVLLAASVFAEGEAKVFRNEFGVNLGPGNPSGSLSLEYSRSLSEHQGWGVGGGFSFDGYNLGLGYRYFFQPQTRFNPYLGFSGFYASGLPFVAVLKFSPKGVASYETLPGFAVAPRAGFRYQAGWPIDLYLNAGYAFVVLGGGVRCKEGAAVDSVFHEAAQKYALGGPELSMSILYRF